MKNKYAVYVSNDKGWAPECPGFYEVFFACGEPYVHPGNGGIGRCGHVVVDGKSAAVALRNKLDTTGDWETPDGKIERPQYAIQNLG